MLAFFGLAEAEFPGWLATAICDDGWYGFPEPLPVGRHVIQRRFESSVLGLYDMRYQLTVVPRDH